MQAESVAIVTGASSGIGRATAIHLAKQGIQVIVADLTEQPRQSGFDDGTSPTADLIKSLGYKAAYVQADLSKVPACQKLVDDCVERFGRLDYLVQCAGINPSSAPFLEQTLAHWESIFNVNARAVFFLMQAGAKQMLKQEKRQSGVAGKIVNIASINGVSAGVASCLLRSLPSKSVQANISAYTGSKHAVVGISKCAAIELAPHGINVNCVAPGVIQTKMTIDYFKDPKAASNFGTGTRLPRNGSPDDIAKAVAFLCSSDSDWMTGTCQVVDGGLLAGY